MNIEIIKEIAQHLGIGFKIMTIYRAELTHMKNDGLYNWQIAELMGEDVTKDQVDKWFTRSSQPKAEIIAKLEKMYFEREKKLIDDLRNPKDP